MRIGVDARHLADGRGVARYTRETLGALAAGFPQDELLIFVPGRGPVPAPRGAAVRRSPWPGRLVFGAAATVRRPRLERILGGGLDVVWVPAPAPIALAGDVPHVVTVHDLSFVTRPGDFTTYERLWHRAGRLRALTRSAARVVAVSGATRDDLVREWAVDPERIDVVHPGVWAARGTDAGRAAVPSPYLLFVGALEPRKAIGTLGEAFSRARERGLVASLVVAGDGRLRGELEGREGVHLLGSVHGGALDPLYRGALAVVLASWLEGFGMPPTEALVRGVPAIVSELPVYDETIGAGGLRVAPGDADALAEALLRIEREPDLRARLVAAGQAAVAPLTWEACAAGVRASLQRAAGGA